MAVNTLDLYSPQVLALVEQILKNAVGCPRTVVTDEAQFRLAVLEPGWDALPLSLRLMGRQQLPVGRVLPGARKEVFLAAEGKVTLRPDTPARIRATLQRLFGRPRPLHRRPRKSAACHGPTVAQARILGEVPDAPPAAALASRSPSRHAPVPVAAPVPTRPTGPPPPVAAAPTASPGHRPERRRRHADLGHSKTLRGVRPHRYHRRGHRPGHDLFGDRPPGCTGASGASPTPPAI